MSYQKNPIEVTPQFFDIHAKVVTAIPPEEVPTIGGRGGSTKAKLNSTEQKSSRTTVFSDVDRFITAELKAIIEKNNLFAFGYSYNCMNRSEHVRIVITNLRKVELRWYSESNWAYLSISKPSPNSYLGMIEYSDCGKYKAYNYGDHSIVIPNIDPAKEISMFDCSRFMLVDKDVKVCEYNKEKCQRVVIPNSEFQIIDDKGLHLLAKELRAYIDHVRKSGSPLEGLVGESIFATSQSYITITKDVLANSGGCINILPESEMSGKDSYPKNWPIARIIKDVTPFVPEEFSKYLKKRGTSYMSFAIDNGAHPSMSTDIPSLSVVVTPADSVRICISVDYRAITSVSDNPKHGEVKFYRCPLIGGYSVYMKGKCLGHDFDGRYDISKKGVQIDSENGFAILECAMRRGNL